MTEVPAAPQHREHDVADRASLERAAAALAQVPDIAVDVETNGMHAYRARLCFVQLAAEEDIWVVDTLAPGVEARGLQGPFGDPGRRKIFHDAQGDLRVLAKDGVSVHGIFDTHRAATLLGLPKNGLGDLVEERFGVRLAKEHQKADFGVRPLPPEVRAYVAGDVRFLIPLARQLEAEAAQKGIAEELLLEFQRLEAAGREPEDPPRLKVPGRDPLVRAVAEAADRLRQRQAEARDVPVGRVLPNAALVEIATRRPKNRADLSRLQGVKGSFVREVGDEMLAAIVAAEALGARGELPPPEPAEKRDRGSREREAALKTWRAEVAKTRGVVPSVVLPTYLVDRLAAEPAGDEAGLARLPFFGEKRLGLYGKAILDVLRTVG